MSQNEGHAAVAVYPTEGISVMGSKLEGRHRGERGATAVEYGLLVALIAGAIIAIIAVLGPQVAGLYTDATQGW